jgi:hypothetical protein
MTRITALSAVWLLAVVPSSVPLRAQSPLPSAGQANVAATVQKPPATKLEAFAPAAGTVVTYGYDDLGNVRGISVEARELRDSKGNTVRGVVVQVTQSQYREERSFIDVDELPELIKGIDALLDVKGNPTAFDYFEVRYTTKGELQIAAFNNNRGQISYAVKAGRVVPAQAIISQDQLVKLRSMFVSAQQTLSTRETSKQ